MPELIQCPSCKRKLRVPDNLMGKKVKCPSCSSAFTAATAEEDLPTAPLIEEDEAPRPPRRKPLPPPPPEEQIEEKASRPRRRPAPPPVEDEDDEETFADEEDRPRRRSRAVEEEEEEDDRPRRKRGGKADWSRVRSGVTFVLISICVLIGAFLIAFIGGMIIGMGAAAAMAPRPGQAGVAPPVAPVAMAGTGIVALAGFTMLMQLAAQVLSLLGYFFCMAAPRKHGARTLAITTLGLAAGSLVMSLLGGILMFVGGVGAAGLGVGGMGGGAAGILGLIGNALNLGKYFTFLLFIMAVAKCIRDYALERNAKNLTILSAIGLVGVVLWFVLTIVLAGAMVAGAMAQGGPGAGAGSAAIAMIGCSCAMVLIGLTIFVWYIVLLVQTRGAIADYEARR